MSVTRPFLVPLTSIVGKKKYTMEVNGTRNCLVTDILLNIFLSVHQKKEIHTGLKQHEGEYMMTEFSF